MFSDLRGFLDHLRRDRDLIEISAPVDPVLEAAEIHRRVIAAGGPALLFTNIKGAAFPLAIVGIVQLAAGIVLLARTDAQVADRDARLDRGKRPFLDLEAPRIERVRTEFGALAVTELALLVAGLGLSTFGAARRDHRLTGIGGGLALQSAVMFTFDAHASARADAYAAEISACAR